MLNIAFYFDASHLKKFSFKDFESGRLGVSGTDASLLRVALRLAVQPSIKFSLFFKGSSIDGDQFSFIRPVDSVVEAVGTGGKEEIDFLIFNFIKDFALLKQVTDLADSLNLKLLIWAHNPIDKQSAEVLVNAKSVVKVIFVEANDLNHTRHTPIFYKGIIIPNGIEQEVYATGEIEKPKNVDVLYLGSLTPGKGFHYLAKAWAGVLDKVPNARLIVIGSGKLYNNYAKLGPLGVADEAYEKELAPYIGGTKTELEKNNIVLYGMLNRNEVIELIRNASVACINPSYKGSLESCSVSSLEIQMCGIPIIGGRAGGNLNTILDGKTGFLVKDETELSNRIVELLTNNDLNFKMRINARKYVLSKYEIKHIIKIWMTSFGKLHKNEKFSYPVINKQERHEYKLYLKEAYRVYRKVFKKA